jgi:phosphate/sulfate permease
MFLIISWVLSGAIFGSIGVAGIASALATGRLGYETSIEAVAFLLLTTTVVGAVGGGFLARMVRRKFAGNQQRLNQFAIFPLLAAAALVAFGAARYLRRAERRAGRIYSAAFAPLTKTVMLF